MEELDKAQEIMKKNTAHQWQLRLEINHMNAIQFTEKDELSAEVWEAITQLLSLLEAIHYTERKQTIIDFNNSLKDSNDGKSTEE
jgi:hypothetical protein